MKSMQPKDPDAVLDYTFDWGPYLASNSDAIASHDVAIDDPPDNSLVIEDFLRDGAVVTVWLSGGTLDQTYIVRCRVTTTGGRTDDRSFSLYIAQQ